MVNININTTNTDVIDVTAITSNVTVININTRAITIDVTAINADNHIYDFIIKIDLTTNYLKRVIIN